MGPMDRCQTVTTNGIVARTCTNKAANDLLQIKDNDCTLKTNPMNIEMEFCVCDKEGCDPKAESNPSAKSTPSAESASISKSQFANQVIIIVAVSSLMKLVLN